MSNQPPASSCTCTAGSTIQIDQSSDPCRVTVAGQPSSADQVRQPLQLL